MSNITDSQRKTISEAFHIALDEVDNCINNGDMFLSKMQENFPDSNYSTNEYEAKTKGSWIRNGLKVEGTYEQYVIAVYSVKYNKEKETISKFEPNGLSLEKTFEQAEPTLMSAVVEKDIEPVVNKLPEEIKIKHQKDLSKRELPEIDYGSSDRGLEY